jgi:hypothetical protein
MSTTHFDGVPTYLGAGDRAGRFADDHPAWMTASASSPPRHERT